ncbi:hypothetical protein BRC81_05630 [Halobacteriales archaeon QS_1_68_20]|nr:MAG: hypothetical protein BRC81_05630 [Halobacteriales archaeon QS_1_68_20]
MIADRSLSDAELRREAREIFSRIQRDERELPDGDTGWISYDLTNHDSREGTLIMRGGGGLYAGHLGIALYFAGMYDVFGEESYRESVRSAVDVLVEEEVEDLSTGADVGIGTGVGSFVYGFSALADLTGEQRYQQRALEFAGTITDEQVQADDSYDLLLGTAGTLTGLLRLYEQSGEESVLDRAIACGQHLLDERLSKWGYGVWDTHQNEDVRSFSTGMGHGAAGIAASLYRLYAHTGREAFREAADEAVDFENVFYSEYRTNWRANWQRLPEFPTWWCYGVPGIGLSRIGSLQYHDREVLRRDLDRARAFDPELGSRDSICHGTFSQVEFLIELGRRFDDRYLDRARRLASHAIERKRERGDYLVAGGTVDGLYNPSLFLGTAGIGYTILRLLSPEDLPSILRFE